MNRLVSVVALSLTVALGNTTSLMGQSTRPGVSLSREHFAMLPFKFETNLLAMQSGVMTMGPTQQMDMAHVLAATYYSLQDELEATLTLSNQGPRPLIVSVTLFALSGERLNVPAVTIPPNTVRDFAIRQWTQSAGDLFAEGSVQVSFWGVTMELGGVVKLIDAMHSLVFDEELTEPVMMFKSSRLEGTWWLPSDSAQMRVALSNTTASSITSAVTVTAGKSGEQPKVVSLAPHETKVLDAGELVDKESHRGSDIGGISIRHSGSPGDLLARGYIQERATGFSNVVEFYDPGMFMSSTLTGAGLRIADVAGQRLRQVAIARNVGNQDTVLRGRLSYTLIDGRTGELSIPAITLAHGQIKAVRVAESIDSAGLANVSTAGLHFDYSASPGTVIMSVLAVSDDQNSVFRVPIVDAAAQPSSTGYYPWSIDDNNSSFVYLTNASDQPQQYTMSIRFEGGIYSLGLRSLAPGQSIAFDLRKMRDDKTPDQKGQVLPSNATHGQVHWSLHGLNERKIIGRVEQANISAGMSITSACGGCCSDSFYDSYNDPSSATVYVGATLNINSYEVDEDCYGDFFTNNTSSDYDTSWSSDNSSVVEGTNCNQYGNDCGQPTIAVGPGTARITANWTGYTHILDCDGNCVGDPFPVSGSSTVTVLPTITSLNLSANPWWFDTYTPAGYNTTVVISANVNPSGGSFTWTITAGTDKVVFSNNSSSITTSNNNATFTTIGPSRNANDVTIRLTYTVNSQSATATLSFPVRAPYALVSTGPNDNRGAAPNACLQQGNFGWYSLVHYQLQDQFNEAIGSVGVTESFSGKYDTQPNNWPIPQAVGAINNPDGTLADQICISGTNFVPAPTPPQNPLGTNLVDEVSQSIYVGTNLSGQHPPGVHVQDDLQYRYIDHGTHFGIASPPGNWPN